jgi:hypothetical protein
MVMTNSGYIDKNDIIRDAVLETMMKLAAKEAVIEEINDLEYQSNLYGPLPCSKNLDRRIAKIISEGRKAEKRKHMQKAFLRVAAAFGILFVIGSAIVLGVEASRIFVMNAIFNFRSAHISFVFDPNEGELHNEGSRVTLGRMPSGFELVDSEVLGRVTTLIFSNDIEQTIIIRQHAADSLQISIDNERREFETILIGGREAYLFVAFDDMEFSMLMWAYGDYVFTIAANIETDKMREIAENLTVD